MLRKATVSALLGALLVAGLVVPVPSDALATGASGGSFNVDSYSTGNGSGGCFKRGYHFSVSQNTVVNALSGAGEGGTFLVGLYEGTLTSAVDASGRFQSTAPPGSLTPTKLLGGMEFTRVTNAAKSSDTKPIILPSANYPASGTQTGGGAGEVTLVPGKTYILAQAAVNCGGSHITVVNLDLVNLVSHPRIDSWGPRLSTQADPPSTAVAGGVYRWNSASHVDSFVGTPTSDINNFYPRLGFSYISDFSLPTVTTGSVQVNGDTITFSGTLTATGEFGGNHPEVALAFEWGTASNPTGQFVSVQTTTAGSDPGQVSFTHQVSGLQLNQTYTYKAVAINEAGRAEGSSVSFTYTPEPSLQNLQIASQTANSTLASANLASLGTSSVTAHGFCFATTTNPQVGGAGVTCQDLGAASIAGTFSATLASLSSGSQIFVRAFATNFTSTAYSNQVTINAPLNTALPVITGAPIATGSALSASEGTWANAGVLDQSTTYAWTRSKAGVETVIAGNSTSSLCIENTPEMIGSTISVTVSKTNIVGSASATSTPTSVVTEGTTCLASPPPPAPPASNTGASSRAPTPPVAAAVPPTTLNVGPRLPETTPALQGPVLRNNQAPTPPAQPTVSVGGRPTPLQTQIPNSNSMNLSAGAFTLGLSLQQSQGTVRQGTGGAAEVEMPGGGRTTLQGSGLLPGSTVQVFLPFNGSNSREIVQIPVSQTGTFSGDAVFGATPTERPLPIGRHVMQVVTVDENRQQVVVEMTINIAQPAPTPEVDRTQGVAPTLRAGQSIATNGGEPELVTVIPNSGEKSATVQGEGWSMAVQVGGDAGGVEPGAEGGAAVTFVRDQGATVSGNGFMPGTRADVWLFSDPTLLGSVQIDDTGAFNGEVMIDGNVITAGEHTLQLQGVGEDGFVRAANLGVSVEDAAGAVTTEEAAGFLWLLWAMVGLGVVAVGAGGTWWYRRATR